MSGTTTNPPESPATAPAPAAPADPTSPAAAAGTPSPNIESFVIVPGQTIDLATLSPGDLGDTIVYLSQPAGTLSLVPEGESPVNLSYDLPPNAMLDYTAPTTLAPGSADSFSYELVNPATGGIDFTGTVAATIDVAPTVSTLNAVFSAGQTIDLTQLTSLLASPGLPGEQLTITSFQATDQLETASGGETTALFEQGTATAGSDLVFTAPSSGSGVLTYTATDQAGATATGTIDFTIDQGPTISQQGTYVIGHGQTADITSYLQSLVTPGTPGANIEITSASDNRDNILFTSTNGAAQPTDGDVVFEGNNTGQSAAGAGAVDVDVLTYTAVDEFTSLKITQGDSTATIEGSTAPVTGSVVLEIDPGPTAGTVHDNVSLGTTVDLTESILGVVTPGLQGDQITITSIDPAVPSGARATFGTVTLNNGDVTYTGNTLGPDAFVYTVSDQYGDTATGVVDLSVSQPTVSQVVVLPGQTTQLATLPSSEVGDSIVYLSPSTGSLSIQGGSESQANGAGAGLVTNAALDLTEPSTAAPGSVDSFSYELVNATGGIDSIGTVAATIDVAPTASTLNAVFGAGQTIDLTQLTSLLASPGLPGDQLTLESFQATQMVAGTKGDTNAVFESGTAGSGDLIFTAPSSGTGVLSYTVADQAGATATGQIDFTIDQGPTISQQGTYVIGHGQTADITSYLDSLLTPGSAGATVEITGASDNRGNVSFTTAGKGAPSQVIFQGTNTDQSGSGVQDRLTFTAVDDFTSLVVTQGVNGEVVEGTSAPVTGTVLLDIDPGPTAGTVQDTATVGTPVDLTSSILAAVTPGLPGDQITVTSISTMFDAGAAGTTGTVTLQNGDVTYTGSAVGEDGFTYTASDQYGDTATGVVDISVDGQAKVTAAPPTTIAGDPNGGSTIQGVDGPEQITAYGYNNKINANGGSGTIIAGSGGAAVNVGSGNLAVTLDGYNNVVTGGDGADSVSGSQGSTSVTLGNGNNTVNLGGYDNAITLGNGDNTINAGAGSENISVGNGNNSITTGGYQNLITIGSGTDTIIAGAGNDTVQGGGGTDTITLAGYQNQVSLTDSTTTLTNGGGGDTISLVGGSANLMLNGSGNMVFLSAGASATIDDLGQGLQVSIGAPPNGVDAIQNAASDPSLLIDLTNGVGGYASASQALAALVSDGNGGSMLSLGAGSVLDFAGLAPSHFTAANFHIS